MANTQPRRIGGQNGAVYLQGTTNRLLDAYMWEWEGTQTVLDASIKGETAKRKVPDITDARVRVQSFVAFPGQSSPLTSRYAGAIVSVNTSFVVANTPVDFYLLMNDPQNAGANQIIAGQGYISRAQLHVVRDGIITDEIEIEVDGLMSLIN